MAEQRDESEPTMQADAVEDEARLAGGGGGAKEKKKKRSWLQAVTVTVASKYLRSLTGHPSRCRSSGTAPVHSPLQGAHVTVTAAPGHVMQDQRGALVGAS
ncbi:hypothetical protein TgHK011_006392 [Trichoderma gracile]|nr:hypothetical protein TgHK011_006392 [Trichoderma gracile]